MDKFKIGDDALCVNNGILGHKSTHNLPPLTKGKIYTVKNIMYCSSCGIQVLDVGLSDPSIVNHQRSWCSCGGLTAVHGNTRWCSSKRFVKPLTNYEEEVMEQVNEILNPVKA